MKKTVITLATVAALAFGSLGLAGCASNDKKSEEAEEATTEQTAEEAAEETEAPAEQNPWVGMWQCVSMIDGQSGADISEGLDLLKEQGQIITLQLNEDGTANLTMDAEGPAQGTWESTSETEGTLSMDGVETKMSLADGKLSVESDDGTLGFELQKYATFVGTWECVDMTDTAGGNQKEYVDQLKKDGQPMTLVLNHDGTAELTVDENGPAAGTWDSEAGTEGVLTIDDTACPMIVEGNQLSLELTTGTLVFELPKAAGSLDKAAAGAVDETAEDLAPADAEAAGNAMSDTEENGGE